MGTSITLKHRKFKVLHTDRKKKLVNLQLTSLEYHPATSLYQGVLREETNKSAKFIFLPKMGLFGRLAGNKK